MKIALLSHRIYPYATGGMQKHSYALAMYMAQKGAEVHLYYTVGPEARGSIDRNIYPAGVNVHLHEVPCPREYKWTGKYIWWSYEAASEMYHAIVQNAKVDFVYAQGLMGWRCLKEKRKHPLPPIGVNPHGLEMYQVPATVRSRMESYVLRPAMGANLKAADLALSLGGGLSVVLQRLGIPPERIVDSPNGVAETWLTQNIEARNEPLTFVFVGRYERRKGIQELNAAIVEMEETDAFRFEFVGPIPEKLQRRSPHITYWGLVRDENQVRSILRRADVLVCPSYSEGLPTVILEAMASGLAVIATPVGAVDAVVSEDTGWLVPPGDGPALLQAMRQAIHAPKEVLKQKKENGRDLVERRYLWDVVAQQTLVNIESALSRLPASKR